MGADTLHLERRKKYHRYFAMFAWRAAKWVARGGKRSPAAEVEEAETKEDHPTDNEVSWAISVSTEDEGRGGSSINITEDNIGALARTDSGVLERYSSKFDSRGDRKRVASSIDSSGRSAALLRSERLSAIETLKDRGNYGYSTDRYVNMYNRSSSKSNRSSHRRNSRSIEEGVLSQFSPYIAALSSEADASNPSTGRSFETSAREEIEKQVKRCAPCFGGLKEHEFLPSHLHGAPTRRSTQVALEMFQNMQIYDSQNYEPSDSKVDRNTAVNLPRRHYILSSVYRWLLALSIGLTMGVVTFCMLNLMNLLTTKRVQTTEKLAQKNMTPEAIAFFICLAAVFGLGATIPVSFISPVAGGSGIAEMKVYLNGIHIPGLLRFSTLAIKAFSLCCSIPSGMVVGTAGPYVHLGAIVGGGLGSLGSNKFKFKLNKGHVDFQSKFGHRSFVTIGIASGIATIFTAPIGGVLIAFEDCGSFYLGSTKMFWQCFLATCMGVYVNQLLNLTVQHGGMMHLVDYTTYTRAFGLYTDVTAVYSDVYRYTYWEVIPFAVMGMIAGLAGSLFVYLHMVVHKFRGKHIPPKKPWMRAAEAVAIAVVTASIAISVSYISPCSPLPKNIDDYPMSRLVTTSNGTDVYQNPNFNTLWCPPGTYSKYGTLFLSPAGKSLREILHLGETVDGQDEFAATALVGYMTLVYVGLILTYGCSIAGGTMVPLLTAGAAYGRLCAKLVKAALVAMGHIGAAARVSYSTYAVIGAASLQSGASRMTMSIAVLVLETCGALELTIPLMITIFFAKAIGDLTGTGLYDAYIALKGVPYLPEDEISYEQKMIAEKLDVQEVMTTDLVCLPPVPTVGQVVRVLKTCKHSAFPVVEKSDKDDEGDEDEDQDEVQGEETSSGEGVAFPRNKMLGYIFRSQLLNMLDKGIGFLEEGETSYDLMDSQDDVLSLAEVMKDVPIKRDAGGQDEVIRSLSQEDIEVYIDLRPFMQLDPCIISSTANVAKAYRLFQKMGLSHLYVAPPGPRSVIGVITRKDLTMENCRLQLGERASYEIRRAAKGVTFAEEMTSANLRKRSSKSDGEEPANEEAPRGNPGE